MTRRDFLSTGALLGASLSVLPGRALAKDDVVSTTATASDGGA
ncbi:MAG: twin-arginine translocation signal domain-containing protein, partial [Lentisphaerae bacterium]|nr:twin-arginine translocation signal domain-containing protein [Lentisphaerota bacterium]